MSDFFSPSLETQMMLLRGMTKNTGILHEAQVTQFKAWPIVLLSHAKSSTFYFDWENKNVIYDISVAGRGKKKEIDRAFPLLDHWTKTLLGAEYQVVVKFNGVQKWCGLRKINTPPPPDPKYDRAGFEDRIWRDNFEKQFTEVANAVPDNDSGAVRSSES
jgi:hypothetical protein